MKNIFKILPIIFVAMGFISITYAHSKLTSAKDFDQVTTIIKKTIAQYGAKNVLVTFDDDDTLLEMPQDLGRVGWMTWQEQLLKEDPKSPYLAAHSLMQLYRVHNILFNLSTMIPTDKHLVDNLKSLLTQHPDLHMIVASDRNPELQDISERQFRKNQFTDKNNRLIFEAAGLKTERGISTIPLSFHYCNQSLSRRLVGYYKGIYYLTGADKGPAVKCLLKRLNIKMKAIVFIDNDGDNMKRSCDAYNNVPNVHAVCVTYSKGYEKKERFLRSHKAQEKTYRAWKSLNKAIHYSLKAPDINQNAFS